MVMEPKQTEHLRMLSDHWNLPAVIAGQPDEWRKLTALREWVQCMLNPHGWDHIAEHSDAIAILEAADAGKRFNCWYYSSVMLEVTEALGWTARRLSVGIDPAWARPGNSGHTVTEVWVAQWNKWVVMDADLNAHYEVDGMPAGGLDIHKAWMERDLHRIRCVHGRHIPAFCRTGEGNLYTAAEQAISAVFGAYDAIDYYVQLTASGIDGGPALCWLGGLERDAMKKNGTLCNGVFYTNDPNMFNVKA